MWPQADLPLVSHVRWVSIVLWKCRSYPFAVLPLWWGKLCLPVWEVRSRAAFKTIKIFSKSRSACHLCDNRNQMVAPKDMVSIDWLYLYIWGISFFFIKVSKYTIKVPTVVLSQVKEDLWPEVSRQRRSGSEREPKHQHQQHQAHGKGTVTTAVTCTDQYLMWYKWMKG